MRFLFVEGGLGLLPLARKVGREGHTVKLCTVSDWSGDGEVPISRLESCVKEVKEGYDVVVVDGVKYGELRDKLHKMVPTIGPTVVAKALSNNTKALQKVCLLADVEYSPKEVFTVKTQEIKEFVEKSGGRVEVWSKGVRIGSYDDMEIALAGTDIQTDNNLLELQARPKDSRIYYIGAFFNGNTFVDPVMCQVWYEKSISNLVGSYTTGPTAISGWRYRARPMVFQSTLQRMSETFRASDHR